MSTAISLNVPAANGNGTASVFGGGDATLVVHGSAFDSGTVTLELSVDGTNYVPAKDANNNAITLTASGMFNVNLPANSKVRIALTGAVASANNVTAKLVRRFQTVQSQVM